MRRMMASGVVVIAVIVVVSAFVDAQSGGTALEGAWVLQDMSYAKPPAFKVNKPTGMLLLTGTHFATVALMDSSPRPGVGASGATAKTMDELLATWGPVRAQAGTFQVSGNKVTWRTTIAKGSEPMAAGMFTEDTITIKGDSLVLVSTRNQGGPTANPVTRRFVRAK
jgi:hypothetical protein